MCVNQSFNTKQLWLRRFNCRPLTRASAVCLSILWGTILNPKLCEFKHEWLLPWMAPSMVAPATVRFNACVNGGQRCKMFYTAHSKLCTPSFRIDNPAIWNWAPCPCLRIQHPAVCERTRQRCGEHTCVRARHVRFSSECEMVKFANGELQLHHNIAIRVAAVNYYVDNLISPRRK